MSFIFVALGGALGAVLRYAISLIPVKTDFSLEDDDPEIKRMTQMNLRREEVKKQKGVI